MDTNSILLNSKLKILSYKGLIDIFSIDKFERINTLVIKANNLLLIDIFRVIEIIKKSKFNPSIFICLTTKIEPSNRFLDNFIKKYPNLKINVLSYEDHKKIINKELNSISKLLDNKNIQKNIVEELIFIFKKFYLSEESSFMTETKTKYAKDREKDLGIIVQARMSSSRLPGKAMLEIAGEPVILKILKRISKEFGLEKTVFSTSTNPKDDILYEFVKSNGFKVYRGEENNIADRFLEAALDNNFKYILRVTGDDLFRDLEMIKNIFNIMKKMNYDYIYSDDLMLGCNSEIMKIDTLKFIREFAKFRQETHALSFFLDRSDIFYVKRFLTGNKNKPLISLALDELGDYISIRRFWEKNESFCEGNWEYTKLLDLINKNIKNFNHHPLDVGLLNRDSKLQSFSFEY